MLLYLSEDALFIKSANGNSLPLKTVEEVSNNIEENLKN
jgi:hypothetical protein